MKKLLLLLFLLPVFAFAQVIPPGNDSTAIGTPGASYNPFFRVITYGGKTLPQYRIGTSAKWMTLSTTQYNRNYVTGVGSFTAKLDSFKTANNTWVGKNNFLDTINVASLTSNGSIGAPSVFSNAYYGVQYSLTNSFSTNSEVHLRAATLPGSSFYTQYLQAKNGSVALTSDLSDDSTYNASTYVAKMPDGFGAKITGSGGVNSNLSVDNSGGLTISSNAANVPGPSGFPTALHVVGMDARNYGIVNDNFGSSGGIFFGRRSQGTGASPTATQQQQALVDYSGAGYGSTGWGQAGGSFRIQAGQNYTDQNQGAMMTWYLTPLNTKSGEANGLKPVMQLTPDGALNITDLFEKIGGLITPTNTGRRPSLTINNNTSKDSLIVASDLTINPTYVQKGTAGSANILINRTETTLGSGTHKFASWQVAGAEKFSVDRTGLTNSQRVFANATAGTTAEDMGVIKNGTANFGLTNYNNATNMTSGGVIGQFAFNGYQNSSVLGVARITGYYMGDGTTRYGDLGFSVQNNGSYGEILRLSNNLNVGIGTGATVSAKLHVLSSTATQMRLGYATGVYTDISTASNGNVTVSPTGGTTNVTGNLSVTGNIQDNTLTASQLVQTDASKNLVSTTSLPIGTKLPSYTVATLPAGTIGMMAYVTDATAPTYLGALTGGGSVVTPVFYNGTTWVSH